MLHIDTALPGMNVTCGEIAHNPDFMPDFYIYMYRNV